MFGQNRVIFVTVSPAISFHQWFMQGCDSNCCTFSLRGRGVGVRQISSLEAYRLTLPPLPHPPPLRRDLIKDRLNFSLFVNLGIFFLWHVLWIANRLFKFFSKHAQLLPCVRKKTPRLLFDWCKIFLKVYCWVNIFYLKRQKVISRSEMNDSFLANYSDVYLQAGGSAQWFSCRLP